MWTFYELKSRAKEVLRTSYGKSLLAILICNLIGGGINLNVNTASVTNPDISNIETAIVNNIGPFSGLFGGILVSSLLVSFFITFPINVGRVRFFNESARDKISLKEVFYPFTNGLSNYLNIVKVGFFKILFLFLWGMVPLVVILVPFTVSRFAETFEAYIAFTFIIIIAMTYLALIPMIVKYYQYFFVEYILADEPGIGWREALKKSKAMADGNKFRIFLLGLSFVGWFLLGAVCFGIGVIFVMPYINATFTELYLKLKDNTDKEYVYSQSEYEEI